jgi:hypothetical protein
VTYAVGEQPGMVRRRDPAPGALPQVATYVGGEPAQNWRRGPLLCLQALSATPARQETP